MYKTYTSSKLALIAAVTAASLFSSSAVLAGKGKDKAPGKPGDETIVGLALATEDFSSLVDAILCFGPPENNPVVDLLSAKRPFTVFAPNNEAFDTLIDNLPVDDICELDASFLFSVLAYHVTNGRRYANSVFNLNQPKMIKMFSGESIITNSNFTITDLAEQTVTLGDLINVKASNGVIHEINSVLIPVPPEE
jgi:uncharacterized surface protein with fasciclin (FAS1) repeats